MFKCAGIKRRSIWIDQRQPKVDHKEGCIGPDLDTGPANFLGAAVDFKFHLCVFAAYKVFGNHRNCTQLLDKFRNP